MMWKTIRDNDTKFTHAGAQCTAIEAKNLGGTVFPADFPAGLFKYADDMIAFNRFQGFQLLAQMPVGFFEIISQMEFWA